MTILHRVRSGIGFRLMSVLLLLAVALCAMVGGSLWLLRGSLVDAKKNQVRAIVEAGISIIERHHDAVAAGRVSDSEARTLALLDLEALRYEGVNYLWVNDTTSRLLMHPFRKDLLGADLSDFRDAGDQRIFSAFTQQAAAGGGYVYYLWPRPGTDIQEPKISYVTEFQPWGWVVGTGLYVGDVEAEFSSMASRFALFVVVVLGVALAVIVVIARGIVLPLRRLTALTVRLSRGGADIRIPYTEKDDEVGELARALQIFQNHIRTISQMRMIREQEQQQAAESLQASEERVRLLLESTGDGIYGVDREGRCTIMNPAAQQMLGLASFEQISGMNAHELFHHHFEDGRPYPSAQCPIRHCLEAGHSAHVEHEVFYRVDGSSFPVDYRVHPLRRDGQIVGAVVSFTDISKRRQAEADMKIARTVFDTTTEGIVVTDARNIITAVNPAFERITGYAASEVIGQTPSLLSSGKQDEAFYTTMWLGLLEYGNWQGEIWNRRKSGELYAEWLTITVLYDSFGHRAGYVAIFSDVTARAHAAARIRHEASSDPLTSLANRRHFEKKFRQKIELARAEGKQLAVLFIDLDRFKPVNDTLGHAIGDRLLLEVAERLKTCVRNSDLVARVGGDEFAVVLDGLGSPLDSAALAGKMVDSIANPYQIDGHPIEIGASIGLALFPLHGEDAQVLIDKADAAMYRAKNAGRCCYRMAEESV